MEKTTRSIFGLSAAHFINDIYSPVLPAILPLLILQEGYSYFLAGVLVTAYNLTSSFTQPVIGWLFDRKNIRIPIAVSVLFSAFFMSFIGLVHNYTLLILFAMGGALGHAFFHPGALGLVSRMAKGANRARLTSFFVIGGNMGFAVGPILAGLAVGYFGMNGLVILVIPAILMVVSLNKIIVPFSDQESGHGAETVETGVKKFPYVPVIMLVTASAFRAWVIFATVAFMPTYLAEQGMSLVTANLLTSVMLLAGVAGQVVGAGISDRYGKKKYVLLSICAAIPAFLLFLFTTGIMSLVALVAFGYLLWSSFSVTVAMSHEIATHWTGMVSGLMLGLAVGVGGVGVSVTGYFADITSVQDSFALLLIPMIIALALFLLLPYREDQIQEGRNES